MRHKKKINKPNKFCKLFGVEIEYEQSLNDAEVRLFHLYLRIVDWDSKHEAFGSLELPVRDIRQYYLPHWSIGKISETQNSLIQKSWLERRSRSRIAVTHYEIYRQGNVRVAEHLVHQVRQGVQLPERDVQRAETRGSDWRRDIDQKIKELHDSKTVFVRDDEQFPWSKET